ncbi:MAG: DUF2281 domain-containing protein [Bacteroidia bacterium]
MQSTQLLQKISSLPEAVQTQLLDYIEFLLLKYQSEDASMVEEGELSEYGQQFLDKRLQETDQHPENQDSWKNVKQRLYERKNWKEK